ncbi:hypothetical protein ACFO3O_19010 [Dokdonia ponticola]|uniref:DUF4145 domain-containing protein n=1 Tax=Dokdonia ponticola TaxID=2041041 RepID=A0ABV9I0Q4_9FLAO
MKDPILQGNEIFNDILSQHPQHIVNLTDAKNLLCEIIKESNKSVLVDFISCGGWDHLTGVEIDIEHNLLYLIDENYKSEDNTSLNVKTGCVIKFKELIHFYNSRTSAIFLRGYTFKKKEIEKHFSRNSKFNFNNEFNDNFSKAFKSIKTDIVEELVVYNTPIYSISILPFDTYYNAYSMSQNLIFEMNFLVCNTFLKETKTKLLDAEKNDEDTICEKINTGRRHFEFALKIECCLIAAKVPVWNYEGVKELKFPNEYCNLTFGDLVKLIKPYVNENLGSIHNKIVRDSNLLSHDSGYPIVHSYAVETISLMIDYVSQIEKIIYQRNKLIARYTSNFKDKKEENHSEIVRLSKFLNKNDILPKNIL